MIGVLKISVSNMSSTGNQKLEYTTHMKVIEYRTLSNIDIPSLDFEINNLLKAGWQLYGFMFLKESTSRYIQQMVKYQRAFSTPD